jgi:16S rRNA (guanine1207-N2)-methyltransferase
MQRSPPIVDALYGRPPAGLADSPPGAIQLSPLIPGSERLEDQPAGAFATVTVLGPPGVLERRYVLAQALRLLEPGGRLTALAPKDRGGSRLGGELREFGCTVDETARRHHRICAAARPDHPTGIEAAIEAGGPQIPPGLGLWSQPGVFSWDRPDPGTALLLRHLPPLAGRGADFGCGVGALALTVLKSDAVTSLELVDIDRRAIDVAGRNVADRRAAFSWRDLRTGDPAEAGALDFVVMNPPFHDGGAEDRALGAAFIRRAAERLKPGGVCWLVANRHLPYEATLHETFVDARQIEQAEGYKIYEARR